MVSELAVDLSSGLRIEAWAVIWKADGGSVLKDFLLSFGFSGSAEEALGKVETRLKFDPHFRRDWQGGVFYPLRIDLNTPVPPARRWKQ